MNELIRFLRSNNLSAIVAAFSSREVHPAIQFLKYGLCGVISLALHMTVFFALSATVNPALKTNVADDAVRANHALGKMRWRFCFRMRWCTG